MPVLALLGWSTKGYLDNWWSVGSAVMLGIEESTVDLAYHETRGAMLARQQLQVVDAVLLRSHMVPCAF